MAATVPIPDVRLIFEKYGLHGAFAVDCGKPPTPDNLHFINRLLADGTVEREQLSGPATRDWVVFLDKATELGPNEIFVSGKRDDKAGDGVWRIDGKRMLQMEVSWGARNSSAMADS